MTIKSIRMVHRLHLSLNLSAIWLYISPNKDEISHVVPPDCYCKWIKKHLIIRDTFDMCQIGHDVLYSFK